MKKIKLGYFLESYGDGIHGTPEYDENGEYYFINGNNLSDSGIIIDKNTAKISKEEYERIKRPLTESTLLLSINGTLGKISEYNGEKIALGKSACYLNVRKPTEKYFVKCIMQTREFKKYILLVAHGSTIKNLAPSQVADYTFEIPEDLDIANASRVLKNLEDKIINNKKICAELESMAKTLYDYWFVQFDFPDENGKPYKASGGKMTYNEQLKREIPAGWEVTTVGEITTCHDSERIPLSDNERAKIKGNIPYYGATCIMDYVNRPIFDGDYVLLAEDGSVMDNEGLPVLQRIHGKVWVNNHAHVLEPTNDYSCKLLMYVLKNIPVVKIKTGSIQMKINQKNLNEYKILDIPCELKRKIYTILDPIDKKQIALAEENRELASLRDFLLPMLMNGQVTGR